MITPATPASVGFTFSWVRVVISIMLKRECAACVDEAPTAELRAAGSGCCQITGLGRRRLVLLVFADVMVFTGERKVADQMEPDVCTLQAGLHYLFDAGS